MDPKFFTVMVGALVQVPPTDGTQHMQIDRQTIRQTDRHGKGSSSYDPTIMSVAESALTCAEHAIYFT